jgi:hypothetical protein
MDILLPDALLANLFLLLYHSSIPFIRQQSLSRVGFCHAAAWGDAGTASEDGSVGSGPGERGLVDGLRGSIVVGQASGTKCPMGSRPRLSTATKMRRSPRAKQLCSRGCDRLVVVRRAICSSGNASNPAFGLRRISLTPTACDPQGGHRDG